MEIIELALKKKKRKRKGKQKKKDKFPQQNLFKTLLAKDGGRVCILP